MRGIAVFGENGSGKSTLAHALAKELDLFEMDAEDYYFPQQKADRLRALEGTGVPESPSPILPFSASTPAEEIEAAMLADIRLHPRFVISAVTPKWCDEILSQLSIAFWLQAPLSIRLERIFSREQRRFGARVLPGGDMHEQQLAFRQMVETRDPDRIRQYAQKLPCQVIVLDGTKPVEENLRRIKEYIE